MSGRHPVDEELVLAHYEGEEATAAREHLAVCPDCRARQASLLEMLSWASDEPIPERSEAYGEEVWKTLEPRLRARTVPLGRVAWPLAIAASIVVAFLVGRHTAPQVPQGSGGSRERVFLASVEDHIDRSQRVLMEVSHQDPRGTPTLESERRVAQDLVLSNRLYRQTAARSGDPGLEDTLSELERVLLEVQNSPDTLSPQEMKDLQKRIDSLIFKLRVVGSRVRHRKDAMLPPATS